MVDLPGPVGDRGGELCDSKERAGNRAPGTGFRVGPRRSSVATTELYLALRNGNPGVEMGRPSGRQSEEVRGWAWKVHISASAEISNVV